MQQTGFETIQGTAHYHISISVSNQCIISQIVKCKIKQLAVQPVSDCFELSYFPPYPSLYVISDRFKT